MSACVISPCRKQRVITHRHIHRHRHRHRHTHRHTDTQTHTHLDDMEGCDGKHGGDVRLLQLEAHVKAQEEDVPAQDVTKMPRGKGATYMTAHSEAPNIHWLYQY